MVVEETRAPATPVIVPDELATAPASPPDQQDEPSERERPRAAATRRKTSTTSRSTGLHWFVHVSLPSAPSSHCSFESTIPSPQPGK